MWAMPSRSLSSPISSLTSSTPILLLCHPKLSYGAWLASKADFRRMALKRGAFQLYSHTLRKQPWADLWLSSCKRSEQRVPCQA